jgi:hypothetical protein
MSAVPPIADDLFKLINALAIARHKMPKAHKHELGAQMFNTALNCQRAVIRANITTDKIGALTTLIVELDILWTFFRLCYNVRAFSSGEYKILSERLATVSSQAAKWLKWAQKNAGSKPAPE